MLILAEDYMGGANAHPPLMTTMDPSIYSKVNGEHRRQGVLLARGPMIRKDIWVQNARLVDIAPTILYALGVPAPEQMDGVVLEDPFLPLYRQAHPVHKSDQGRAGDMGAVDSGLTPADGEKIRRHLERLGYLWLGD